MKLSEKVKIRYRKSLEKIIAPDAMSGKTANYILFFIIFLVFVFRVSTMDTPPIDRTDWKEIDYIMISENYHRHGYDFFKPEISWPAEEPRITAMELPLVPFLASLLYPVLGINVFSVRIITLVAFLLLVVFTYKLALRETGPVIALATAFFSGLLPMFNPFRNYLFSEPALLFFSVFSIYHYAQWIDFRKNSNLFFFIIGLSVAVALKPTALYLSLPLFWIHFRKYRFEISKYWQFLWPMAISMALPVMWFSYAYFLANNFIDVFGVFGGKFGGHDKFQTLAMLSDLNWYWTMYGRIKLHLLGKPGMLFVILGILAALNFKKGRLFVFYFTAIISFFVIVAEGNLDTIYRQLTIVPPGSFLLALGALSFIAFTYALTVETLGEKYRVHAMASAVLLCGLLLVVYPIRQINILLPAPKSNPVWPTHWAFAQEIKKHATEHSKIILAGEYSIHKGGNDVSPMTYYYSGLTGWTIQDGEWNQSTIDSLHHKGADLFGAIHYREEPGLVAFVQYMASKHEVLYDDNDLLLLKLSLKPDKK